MKNKKHHPLRSDLPVKLHNHLVSIFTKKMEAEGVKKESKAWFKAQENFFTSVLAAYDFLDGWNCWESLYVKHQLEFRGEICAIRIIPTKKLKTFLQGGSVQPKAAKVKTR
jgi:hypothetical protein